MSDKPVGHPSAHRPRQAPNKAPSPAEKGPFSATYPREAALDFDVVHYGPDIGTELDYRLLGDVRDLRVVDLGCGRGHNAIAMARQGAHVIALDPDHENLRLVRDAAERHELKVETHQADLGDLPFLRAESADIVFSAYSLATVGDLDRVFRQVHRILRTDRPLVFSMPHPVFALGDPVSSDPLRIRRRYWDVTPRPWEIDNRVGADHPHTIAELFSELSRANFAIDTLLEPEPRDTGSHSEYHGELMRWIPATLVIRARKMGS